MIQYIINTFRGGQSDEDTRGVEGSFKYGHALDIHKRTDSLSCKQAMAVVLDETRGMGDYGGTTLTGGVFNFMIPASDGSLYAFSERGSIFARTSEGNWTFVYNDPNGAIKGAGEWEGSDGRSYLYWATSSALARKELPGANSAPDTGTMRWTDAVHDYKIEFISSSATWHPIKPIAGALYMGNNEALAQLDFDLNWSPRVMNIKPQNIINALEERDDYAILGSEKRDGNEEGYIWSWVETAVNYVQKKKIPIQGVNALITAELPLLQGGDNGEIFFSDFESVVPLNAIQGGGKVNPGGVDIFEDLAVFGFYGGTYPGIWSYGRARKNRPFALNYDYRLSGTVGGSTISTIGAVAVTEGVLLASFGSSEINADNSYGVEQVSTTTKASAVYEGLEFDGGAPSLQKKFDTVKITMTPMPASTVVSIKFKLNNDTSWKYAVLGNRTTTYSQTNSTSAIFSIGRPAEVYELGAELTPSVNDTPEILSITTYISNEKNEF